jgi:hypothetical protein
MLSRILHRNHDAIPKKLDINGKVIPSRIGHKDT